MSRSPSALVHENEGAFSERPAKVHLSVNMKVAKRLPVDLNPLVLARADEVIE
jgi:hypothetical protein